MPRPPRVVSSASCACQYDGSNTEMCGWWRQEASYSIAPPAPRASASSPAAAASFIGADCSRSRRRCLPFRTADEAAPVHRATVVDLHPAPVGAGGRVSRAAGRPYAAGHVAIDTGHVDPRQARAQIARAHSGHRIHRVRQEGRRPGLSRPARAAAWPAFRRTAAHATGPAREHRIDDGAGTLPAGIRPCPGARRPVALYQCQDRGAVT